MTANPFAQALDNWLARLHHSGRLRVWSVIVTIFGDAIVQRGGTVSAATLQELASRLGMEPGALRTAISRLVRDGWITRAKTGRNVSYQLTANAAKEGLEAAGRIYFPDRSAPDCGFSLAVLPQRDPELRDAAIAQMRKAGWSVIATNVLIAPAQARLSADPASLVALSEPGPVPGWVVQELCPADIATAFGELRSEADRLAKVAAIGDLDPLDALAARIVLIHEWRRLVLRQPLATVAVLGKAWPGGECRAAVEGLYNALIAASTGWLESRKELSGFQGRSESERFGQRSG